MSHRQSKRGKRKKKSHLTDRKRKNKRSKNTYLVQRRENIKLKKHLDDMNQARLREQRLKKDAKAKMKQNNLKHQEELQEIVYENDHESLSNAVSDDDSDYNIILGDEELMAQVVAKPSKSAETRKMSEPADFNENTSRYIPLCNFSF
eukprot:594902_1